MDAIKSIMSILTACGCDPVAQTRNGETFIKVNAPTAGEGGKNANNIPGSSGNSNNIRAVKTN